jgi:hypothetical protein
MKKLFIIFLVLLSFAGYSQITLDFQSALQYDLYPTKLTDTETKYYYWDQTSLNQNQQFSLYNLDGTLFKTIDMPPKPNPIAFSYSAYYITRTLFDNDPSTIEYLMEYVFDSVPPAASQITEVKVIREDGTILLDEPYGDIVGVYSTEEGSKLMLSNYYYGNGTPLPYLIKVFNLPGQIPTSVANMNGIADPSLSLYPNPNNGSFSVRLKSDKGEASTIDLYSPTGKFISTYKSSENPARVTAQGLPSGLYFLNVRSGSKSSSTKMIIQK